MIISPILKYSRRFLFVNVMKCEFFMLCILIGRVLCVFQIFEYNDNPFSMTDRIYSSFLYCYSLHGRHVFVGLCFLIIN